MLGWAKLHEKNGLQWQKMFRTGGFLQVGQTGAATSFSFFNPYITLSPYVYFVEQSFHLLVNPVRQELRAY